MKRIINLAFILTVVTIIYAGQTVSAQDIRQLQFAKGKSSATVKGTTGSNGVYYNLRAKAGQKITVTLTPKSGIGIKIEKGAEEVLLREEKGGTYTVYLEEGGEFSIFLGSLNHRSQAYTLTVSITKMRDI